MTRLENRNSHRSASRKIALLFLMLSVSVCAAGCGSSGGGPTVAPPIAAAFNGSGTAAASDMARLTGTTSGDIVTINVALTGPTTSSDLHSFAFDLVLSDPTVATYQAGSATFGNALTLSGGQQPQVLVAQVGNRVTVGVTKLGGGSGNGVAGEASILSLQFRILRRAMTTITFEGSPPFNPSALDSTGAVVGSVQFDSATAALSGT